MEQAGGGECGVARHLAGEALARAAGEQAVVRIEGVELRGDGAGLAVGGAGHKLAEQGFHAPVHVRGELNGERIEQLGVGGLFAGGAEILRGGDDADPEELQPETVHGDTGGERIFR